MITAVTEVILVGPFAQVGGVSNPAVSACYAILASVMLALLSMAWLRTRRRTA